MSSAIQIYKKNPSPAEQRTSLINSSDGQGLHFDGSAGGINLGSSMPDLGTKYSLEFVVKGDSKTGETYLLDAYKSGARIIFGWSGYSNGNIQLHINGTWSSAFMATPENGEVVHLVLSVDGTSATLYQNGNSVSTQTVVANTMASATSTHIGCSQNGTANYFNGTIYRARFYNKALTSAEVQTAYERADVDFSSQYGTANAPFTSINLSSGWSTVTGGTSIVDSDSFSTTTSGAGVSYPLTIGKRYRVSWNLSGAAYDSIRQYTSGETLITISSATSGTVEFTAEKDTLYIRNGGAGTTDITSMSLVQIGCVSDYELSANPTQSLTVQDRSSAADGTCSASGVTQVQKVVQANVERLAVGGTTPRVGVGLGADVLPSNPLHIQSTDNQILLQGAAAGFGSQTAKINFSNSGQNSLDISTHYPSPSNANEISLSPAGSKSLVVKGGSGSATGPFMTIDHSGKISCVNDITIQKNNGNLILHGTADGSQQAVLFRNDEDEDKGFIKYRDTYSSAGGNTMEIGTDGSTRLTLDASGHIILPNAGQTIKTDLSSGGTTRTSVIELYNNSTGALSLKTDNGATGGIEFWTEGTKRLDVTRGGAVHVGATHANEDQTSSLIISQSIASSGTHDYITLADTSNNGTEKLRLLFKGRYATGSHANGQEAAYISCNRDAGSDGYGLSFGTGDAADAVDRLNISRIGHVAIGDDKYYQWGGTNARIVGSHAGNYVKILTGNSAKLTVDSTGLATFSNGIALQTSPSNDSATANEAYTLDKYETGTFQLADGSGASLTITGGLGRYTRIGDRVFISVQFGMPSVTNGNHMTLEGLPFNTANNDASRGLIISYSGSANVAYSLTTANTDKVSFYTSAGVNASNTNASGASFWLNGHYRTA